MPCKEYGKTEMVERKEKRRKFSVPWNSGILVKGDSGLLLLLERLKPLGIGLREGYRGHWRPWPRLNYMFLCVGLNSFPSLLWYPFIPTKWPLPHATHGSLNSLCLLSPVTLFKVWCFRLKFPSKTLALLVFC